MLYIKRDTYTEQGTYHQFKKFALKYQFYSRNAHWMAVNASDDNSRINYQEDQRFYSDRARSYLFALMGVSQNG